MRRRGIAAAVLLGAVAVAVGVGARRGRIRALDERLFKAANTGAARPGLDRFFRAVTELGSLWASAAAAAVIALTGRRRVARDALGAAAVTWVTGQALKRLFGRTRPYDTDGSSRLLIARPQGLSWPSSHPAVLLAFLTVAARELDLPAPRRAALTALAGVVGVSRVYLGVHYPADVAGGLLLGRAIAEAWPSRSGSSASGGLR